MMKKFLFVIAIVLLISISLTSCEVSKEHEESCVHQGEWVTTTEATCEGNGIKTLTCELCGKQQTQSIQALGHSYKSDIITPATCLNLGKEKLTCSVCNHNYESTISAKGHTYTYQSSSATDICKDCNKKTYSTACTNALSIIYKKLKQPTTSKVNAIFAKESTWESKKYVVVVVNISGQNSFGGISNDEYVCLVNSSSVVFDLLGQLEDQANEYEDLADYYDSMADTEIGQQALTHLSQSITYTEKAIACWEKCKEAAALSLLVKVGSEELYIDEIIKSAQKQSGVFK